MDGHKGGLANYLKKTVTGDIKVAIAYDSRNNSQYFAQITADVFAANGITVFLFPELRPTPLLSFAIRYLKCHSGVVLTASHNPKEYNGYKAYWSDGAQLVPPHDKNVITEVNSIGGFEANLPSYWTIGSAPSGATLTWATDQARSMGHSLKIVKPGATADSAAWISANMCDIWSPKHLKNVDILLAAYVRTQGVNTNQRVVPL